MQAGRVTLSAAGPGRGRSSIPLPIPNSASLIWVELAAQWAVLDSGSQNGVLALSDALAIRIQP